MNEVQQAPRSDDGAEQMPEWATQRRALAARLDCFLDEELQQLACVTGSTLDAWRKRGIGPPYIRLGNCVLYRRADCADFLATRVRGGAVRASSVL